MLDVLATGQVEVRPMPKRERIDQLTGLLLSKFSEKIIFCVSFPITVFRHLKIILTMKNTRVRNQRQGLGEFDVRIRATISTFRTNPPEAQTECMVFCLVNMTCIEKRCQSYKGKSCGIYDAKR